MPLNVQTLSAKWGDYALLDSGGRLKLERFGDCVVVRSEPKAWWSPARKSLWDSADARYFDDDKKSARWEFFKKVSPPKLKFGKVEFLTKFMDGSKHLGVFPEQKPHWEFIMSMAGAFGAKLAKAGLPPRRPTLLNLFGYTGAATLAAAAAGYEAVHVDASKPSVEWARRNQAASGLGSAPIRWIVDDALKFAAREARRGRKYDAIVLDPPAFGRGPKNELWKLEKMLPELLGACSRILSDTPLFVLMTLYSIDASPIMAANVLRERLGARAGFSAECGVLVLEPEGGLSYPLPLSIWASASFA